MISIVWTGALCWATKGTASGPIQFEITHKYEQLHVSMDAFIYIKW